MAATAGTDPAFVVPLFNTSIPNIGPRRSSSIPRRRPPSRRIASKEVVREDERSASTAAPSNPSAPAFNFDAHTSFQFQSTSAPAAESQSSASASFKRKCPHCAGSGFVSCEQCAGMGVVVPLRICFKCLGCCKVECGACRGSGVGVVRAFRKDADAPSKPLYRDK
eukprot:tig00021108_g18329.t1